jgi:hypothetical protein
MCDLENAGKIPIGYWFEGVFYPERYFGEATLEQFNSNPIENGIFWVVASGCGFITVRNGKFIHTSTYEFSPFIRPPLHNFTVIYKGE